MIKYKKRDVWHEVASDEDVAIIAVEYGIKDWKIIYYHQKNDELRDKRPNPNILYKGDKVWVPEILEPKEFKAETDKSYKFIMYPPKTLIHIVLQDDFGNTFEDVRYEIWIEGKKYNPFNYERNLKTREDGLIHHMVPLAKEIEMRIWFEDNDDEGEEEKYHSIIILPGHLDPVDTIEGIQDRLINLGFDCENDPPGKLEDATHDALKSFQAKYALSPTGEIDELTSQKLVELHGS